MPPNIERKARRKRQTRLTFDPVSSAPSSSPGSNMSPAKVRYELPRQSPRTSASSLQVYGDGRGEEGDSGSEGLLASGEKDYMIGSSGKEKMRKNGKQLFKPLPTPVKSSQSHFKDAELEDSESDLDPKQRRKSQRSVKELIMAKHTGKSVRTGVVDSSDGSEIEDEVTTPSRQKKNKGKATSSKIINLEIEEESSSTLASPPDLHKSGTMNLRSLVAPLKRRQEKSVTLSDDSDDLDLSIRGPKGPAMARKAALRAAQKNRAAVNEDESEDESPKIKSSQKRQRQPIVADDSDSDELPLLAQSSTRSKREAARSGASKTDTIEIEDDSDDIITTSPSKRRRSRVTMEEEDSDDPINSPPKRRRQLVDESEELNDIVASPLKQRRQSRVQDEDEDEEEEEEDDKFPLVNRIPTKGNTKKIPTAKATPSRQTRQQRKPHKHRSEKEKKLELLKRRRAGENIDELTDSGSDSEEEGDDSEDEFQALSEFEDESEEEPKEKTRKPARQVNSNGEDHDESDFVVEDEEAPLGVPHLGLMDIPLQFTHAAHKPLKEHFKDVVEWMVHNKINPGFARDDPIYRQAFIKVDDEYKGYAQSKFVSTQWTNEFTKAINARPQFLERPLHPGEAFDARGEVKCDACNHRKHQPSYAIQLKGKAYHKDTLEEVDQSSDDSENDEDDEETGSVNSQGHDIPSENKEWLVGRFCKANAEQAHALIHWKYALNDWVLDTLKREGHLDPEELASRDKMKPKERRNYANNLVDQWGNDGQIKSLYGDFKRQLEAARESKQGRWSGGNFLGFN